MIRNLEPGDLEAALTVWQTANQQVHRFLPAAFWRRRRGEVLAALGREEVYVAVEQGKVVGFIGLHRDWVQGLFLLPEWQGRGIGQQLLGRIKQQRSQLWLQVYHKNRQALEFYLREGFQISRRSLDPDSDEVRLTLVWRR